MLIAINVGVFLLSALIGSRLLGEPLSILMGVSWDGLWQGYGLGLVRLVTHMFAHSYTDIWHIVGNLLVLYFFGTMVEHEAGRRGVTVLYLAGGVFAAVVQMLMVWVAGQPSDIPLVGASGACYALTLYATMMAPRAPVYFLIIRLEMRWLATILVVAAAYYTLLELRGEVHSGTAHAAHLGGALFGYLAFRYFRGYFLALNYSSGPLLPFLDRWRDERRQREDARLQQDLDRLLDKVHREGMGSLSAAERRALERAGKRLKKR